MANTDEKTQTLRFQRKLVEVGNSLFVSIPNDYVKNYGLQKGEEYEFTINPRTEATK